MPDKELIEPDRMIIPSLKFIKSSKLDDIINSINLMNESFMDYDKNIIRRNIVSKYSYPIFQNKLSEVFRKVYVN